MNEFIKESTNGYISGFISSFVCYPIEYYKIVNQNGAPLRFPFSNGVYINSIAYGLHYSIYFPVFKKIKDYGFNSFESAFIAQGVSNIILNPLWIIRTKRISFGTSYYELCQKTFLTNTNNKNNNKNNNKINYKNLFKGLPESSILCFQSGLSFSIMETISKNLKDNYSSDNASHIKLSDTEQLIISSALSKFISSVIIYPFDTIRTIVRTETDNNSFNIIKKIIKNNPRTLYKGFVFYILKSIPSFVSANYIFNLIN